MTQLTTPEAASYLGLTYRTMRNYIAMGIFSPCGMRSVDGRRFSLFEKAHLDAYRPVRTKPRKSEVEAREVG